MKARFSQKEFYLKIHELAKSLLIRQFKKMGNLESRTEEISNEFAPKSPPGEDRDPKPTIENTTEETSHDSSPDSLPEESINDRDPILMIEDTTAIGTGLNMSAQPPDAIFNNRNLRPQQRVRFKKAIPTKRKRIYPCCNRSGGNSFYVCNNFCSGRECRTPYWHTKCIGRVQRDLWLCRNCKHLFS